MAAAAAAWNATRVPAVAWALGGLGLIPFVYYGAQHDVNDAGVHAGTVASASAWTKAAALGHDQATVRRRFLTYGATILSFMGGVQWGLAVAAPVPMRSAQYVVSVLPALAGWTALNLDNGAATAGLAPHGVLGAGFFGLYVYDRRVVRAGRGPAWYLRLRTPLTAVVLASTACAAVLSRAQPPAPPVPVPP